MGNFPDTQAFGKFPRLPGIWGPQNFAKSYRNLRVVYSIDFENFPNNWIFGEFPKNLGILKTSQEFPQISRHLGNFQCWRFFKLLSLPRFVLSFHVLKNLSLRMKLLKIVLSVCRLYLPRILFNEDDWTWWNCLLSCKFQQFSFKINFFLDFL